MPLVNPRTPVHPQGHGHPGFSALGGRGEAALRLVAGGGLLVRPLGPAGDSAGDRAVNLLEEAPRDLEHRAIRGPRLVRADVGAGDALVARAEADRAAERQTS